MDKVGRIKVKNLSDLLQKKVDSQTGSNAFENKTEKVEAPALELKVRQKGVSESDSDVWEVKPKKTKTTVRKPRTRRAVSRKPKGGDSETDSDIWEVKPSAFKTPVVKSHAQHEWAATTSKVETTQKDENLVTASKKAKTQRQSRSVKKQIPPSQPRIDTIFKSCTKTYKIQLETKNKENQVRPNSSLTVKARKGRKRLFEEPEIQEVHGSDSQTTPSYLTIESTQENRALENTVEPDVKNSLAHKSTSKSTIQKSKSSVKSESALENTIQPDVKNSLAPKSTSKSTVRKRKSPVKSKKVNKKKVEQQKRCEKVCIDLCSEGDEEIVNLPPKMKSPKAVVPERNMPSVLAAPKEMIKFLLPNDYLEQWLIASATFTENLTKTTQKLTPTSSVAKSSSSDVSIEKSSTNTKETASSCSNERKRKQRPCPPYKKIEGTTFAVDAFQFGQIEGITHYFLTHYHADHYIGLTRKFAMPLYLSPITARLVRTFIPLDSKYINELELNTPEIIENVEVTAIEANHCPGAIMLIFKLTTGKCILHTGDFRASSDMESEPVFWHNDIHTIYLDTTYISNKYAFCTQTESIDNAKKIVGDFRNKHSGKRILYVCGTYVIGKEKFWSALAHQFQFKVWAEGNRKRALDAMQVEEFSKVLCDDPFQADMHVIPLGKLSYLSLVEYFASYTNRFDMLLALRPSGWEKNTKPQYRAIINIVGVEYSEHSSHNDLERFVKYLKPCEVISTVPVTGNLMITGKVPKEWYQYDKLHGKKGGYQPSITNYFTLNSNDVYTQENSFNANGNTPLLSEYLNALEQTISTRSINSSDSSKAAYIIRNEFLSPMENNSKDAANINHDLRTSTVVKPEGVTLDISIDDDWMD